MRLILGDCIEKMREIPENSIDAVITDPPYGIRFMGKAWDGEDIEKKVANRRNWPNEYKGAGPNGGHNSAAAEAGKYDLTSKGMRAFQEFSREWSAEALRILKPGGHLLSFSSCRTYHRMTSGIEDAGFEIRDQLQWIFGSGFPKSLNLSGEYEGWGTALKPAFEPICMGRKPLVGTVAENVAQFGTGAINIKESRIEDLRWPSNVLFDEEAAAILDEQAGELQSGGFPNDGGMRTHNGIYGKPSIRKDGAVLANSGGASRFFYCAKASQSERNAGLKMLPAKATGMSNGAQAHGEGYDKGQGIGLNKIVKKQNFHPTVKPVDVMKWLIKLVTPPHGTVLDPFMGSGTTGVAARQLGFDFIGFEVSEEYFEIANHRISSPEHAHQPELF